MTANVAAWMLLVISGIAEVVWAIATKFSNGFTRFGWASASVLSLVVVVAALTFALKSLPLGPAYAVWTAIAATGTVLAGVWFFGESLGPLRLVAIAVIILAVIALQILPA